MNGTDIFNGVTDIRDDLIDGAGEAQERKRPKWRWVSAVAAVLAVVLIVGILLPNAGGGTAYAIAEAEYPQREKYSEQNWEDWWEQQRALRDAAKTYAGKLDGWYAASVPEMLSGAGEENRVFSPVNVYLALAMLAEVTDGTSREQILALLGCGGVEELRRYAGALWNANYQDDGVVTSLLANSLWLSENLDYTQETMDTLARDYYASSYRGKMGSGGYNDALRTWVNDHTGGRLAEQAAGLEMAPDTLLALVSTVYYRSRWINEFDPGKTEQDVFHAPGGDVTADFMRQKLILTDYYRGTHFAAVRKELEGGGSIGSMWFFLPDEESGVDQVLSDGEAVALLGVPREARENRRVLNVHLSVPRFDAVSDLDLADSLKALGVTDVFDPNAADFSPMLSPDTPALLPYVSRVNHAARVTVDEEGCEAAAYVKMDLGDGGEVVEKPEEIDFTLDRPFLFAVTGGDGELLFTGVVNHP